MKTFSSIFSAFSIAILVATTLFSSCTKNEIVPFSKTENSSQSVSVRRSEAYKTAAVNPFTSQENVSSASLSTVGSSVALFDARIRSISPLNYVREIFFVDFAAIGSTQNMPGAFTYDGTIYTDNGLGFDSKASDGIFTSSIAFIHTNKIPYKATQKVKSVMTNSVVNDEFQYMDELHQMQISNDIKLSGGESSDLAIVHCYWTWVCGCWGTCCGFKMNCRLIELFPG